MASVATGLCAICGIKAATTRDHIPPRGIFPKPRPKLITVPACLSCNLRASGFDERFRAYLSLHVGTSSPVTQRLFDSGALPTLRHNRRLLRTIVDGGQPVELMTPAGVISGRGMRVLWDSPAHDAVIERTVRGLYYHHFGTVLGQSVELKVQWLRSIPTALIQAMAHTPLVVVGERQFLYRYARAAGEPLTSIWLFNFYDRHFAGGHTVPVG
jgi:hypothetical protein